MKLFKKATAAIALVTLVSGIFSTGVSAYSSAQLEAANDLAARGIIVKKADANGYALDQNVLRQEIAAVARGVAGLEKKSTCAGTFKDVTATTPNTWACYSVEALSDAELIALNDNFRPEANISKAEAVGMMVKAAYKDEYKFDSSLGNSWQKQVVDFAVSKGILKNFSNYDTAATRGFVFEVGSQALSSEDTADNDNDLLTDLLNGLGDDDDTDTDDKDNNVDDTDEDNKPVISGDNVLSVTLSPETPDAATVPGAISGLPVAVFDFEAGAEDVTIKSLTVKRRGLSDKDTLKALAVFSDEGRASKSKDDSQENDTQATLSLSDGGVVVKAGETMSLTVVADINETAKANGDEFSIELIEVVATSKVEGVKNLEANTLEVGGVDAAKVTIEKGSSVADVKIGDEEVEIFKFDVEGDNDTDVVLKTITFKGEGSADEEDDLSNYYLEFDGEKVSEKASAKGKYVTFDLGEGVTIREDKTEKFTVLADIDSGAKETISFKIDKTLDVTAEGKKYGFGASVDIDDVDEAIDEVKIDAGELTLADIDAESDKIRADKTNVELGSIKVTNVSGDELELQKLGVKVTLSGGTLKNTFENFEAVIDGSTYELEVSSSDEDTNEGVFKDDDLDIILGNGVTTIVFQADTKEDVAKDVTVDLVMDNLDNEFYVVETEDDNKVEDITPSTLSFKKLTFIDSGATASSVSLADVNVVRGAEDIVAAEFEIEAEEASSLEVDEIKAKVTLKDLGGTTIAFNNSDKSPNKFISEVAIYKGSVSDSNKLDSVAGTKIATDGTVLFNGFKTLIDANKTQRFVVTLDVVDGADSVSKKINTSIVEISAEDDENDDVSVAGLTLESNKTITVSEAGSFSVVYDAANDDNEEEKTILAGNSETIVSYDVQAKNEEIDVETARFTLSDTSFKSKDAIKSAKLYLDDKLIATTLSKDILAGSAGVNEVSKITVTSAPTSSANATVTLDGTTTNIPLTFSAGAAQEVTQLTVTSVGGAGNLLIKHNGLSTVVAVLASDSINDVATKIRNAIDSTADSASVSGAVVTITAQNNGSQTDLTFNKGATFVETSINVTTQGASATTTTSTAATEIADVINGLSGYSASASSNVVTVTSSKGIAESDISFSAGSTGVSVNTEVTTQGKNPTGSGSNTTITFDDLTNLIIPTEDAELKLAIETANIGFEEVGETLKDINIIKVDLLDAEGVDSGKAVSSQDSTSTSKNFSVYAGIITPSNIQSLSDSSTQAKIKLHLSTGSNKETNSNAKPNATIKTLTFSTPGSTGILANEYELYEEGKSGEKVVGKASSSNVVFDFRDKNGDGTLDDAFGNGVIDSSKTYVIVPTLGAGDTASLTLLKDGIEYTIAGADAQVNLSQEENFGSRSKDS